MSSESTSHELAVDESIVLDDVSKSYRLGTWGNWGGDLRDDVKSLFDRVLRPGSATARRYPRIEALTDVSLRFRQGENIGIIGANGSGKTTLLRLVANITRPSRGVIWVKGRVAALIQLGAGFHRELSGRENVFLYGSILGLNRRQIEERYEEIVAFAGLDRFMETPVKRYSNGMRVRLGFSVAVHVEPDILLIDEVLAVGDQAFREKCLDRMRAYMEGSATLLFVSHDRELVETVCDRAVLLDQGRVQEDGPVSKVLDVYESRTLDMGSVVPNSSRFRGQKRPAVEISKIEIRDHSGRVSTIYRESHKLRVRIHFVVNAAVQGVSFKVSVQRGMTLVFASSSSETAEQPPLEAGESGFAELELGALNLLEGHYTVSAAVEEGQVERTARCDVLERVLHFRVETATGRGTGLVSMGPTWTIRTGNGTHSTSDRTERIADPDAQPPDER